MTTYGQLKMKKAELREKMKAYRDASNGETDFSTLNEYKIVIDQIRDAERRLLRPIGFL